MKKLIPKWYLNLPLRNKINVLFTPVIVLSLCLLGFILYKVYSNLLTIKVSEATIGILSLIDDKMQNTLEKVDNSSVSIIYNDEVQKNLSQYNMTHKINYTELYNFDRYLSSFKSLNNISVDSIYIFTKTALINRTANIYIENENDYIKPDDRIYNEILAGSGAGVWYPSYRITRTSEPGLSYYRAINNIDNFKTLGIININISESNLEQVYSDVSIGKSGRIMIADEENNIISSIDKNLINKNFVEYFNIIYDVSGKNGYFHQYIDGRNMLVAFKKSEHNNWAIFSIVPLNEIILEKSIISKYTLGFVIIFIIISIFIGYLISKVVTRPVNNLIRQMEKVQNLNFDMKLTWQYDDEIGTLSKSFNTMVYKIENLLEEVSNKERRLHSIELSLLQAQINPHFLYNTLDTINWMAHINGSKEICELVKELARFYRVSLSKGKNFITIKEELDHVNSYLQVEMIRFKDKFDYEIRVCEDIYQYKIPKVTVQPIVENAIIHGINEKKGKGSLRITGELREGTVVITVEDDGVGMKNEIMEGILRGHKDNGGYGIFNVNERLKISFNREYGLCYFSEIGKGTKVEIRLPAVINENDVKITPSMEA